MARDPRSSVGSPAVIDSAEEVGAAAPGPRRGRSGWGRLREWVLIVVIALVAALALKTFVVQAFYIPSGSMEPTIHIGDRVLVDKLAYDFGRVHTGDIVVFRKPPSDYDPGVTDLIKRVIGLPGETLRSGPHGEIFVNGHLLAQPWLTPKAEASPGPAICSTNQVDCTNGVLHLPANEYFMMGDNRGNSDDSRYFGPVSGNLIVGKAFVRIWPLSRLHWFAH